MGTVTVQWLGRAVGTVRDTYRKAEGGSHIDQYGSEAPGLYPSVVTAGYSSGGNPTGDAVDIVCVLDLDAGIRVGHQTTEARRGEGYLYIVPVFQPYGQRGA